MINRTGTAALLLGSRVATALVGLLQLSVLARFLPADQFGIAAVAVAAATYICMLGEPPIVGFERVGAQDDGLDLARDEARLAAQAVLALTAAMILVMAFVWGLLNRDTAFAVAVAIWAISFIQLRWSTVQFLQWGQRASFATMALLNSVVRFGLSAGAAWCSGAGSTALIAGGMGSILATALISPRLDTWKWHTPEIKRMLRLGIPSSVPMLGYTSMIAWPTFAASQILGTEQFAAFAAQFSLASAIAGATLSYVLQFGFPVAKKQWDSGATAEATRYVVGYSWFVLASASTLAVLAFVFGNWLTRILLTPAYSGNFVLAVALLAWGLLLLARPPSWILRLQYRQTLLGILVSCAAILQVPAVWFGTAIAGVPGLLLALIAVSLLQTILVFNVSMGRRALVLQLAAMLLATGSAAAVVLLGIR